MRGIRLQFSCCVRQIGITPAGAGHTISRWWPYEKRWDHPRRCGAYRFSYLSVHLLKGSPPQVRGILRNWPPYHDEPGITPAGAGHTISQWWPYKKRWDHPRRCGAYNMGIDGEPVYQGSPPQVRGILIAVFNEPSKIGITPAGAGHTSRDVQILAIYWDHPRRCGAYSFAVSYVLPVQGSPPQVRGIPVNNGGWCKL